MHTEFDVLFITSGMLFLRTFRREKPTFFSSKTILQCAIFAVGVAVAVLGGLFLLLSAIAISLTVISLASGKSVNHLLSRISVAVGGWEWMFVALGSLIAIAFLAHGQPAHALFDEARNAAKTGIGGYIGEDESTSIIDTILFAMWALTAVGGLAAIAGGVAQQVQVLVGGLVLFFGMAVLIGILEFTSKLLFGGGTAASN